ncbi:MAG: SHD1 domain-containing protein [Pirellulales bacterium]
MRSWLLCLPVLFAAASDAHARVWTSASGEFQFEASVVAIGPDVVRLQFKQDGSVHDLPLTALSSIDNKYIRENARQHGSTGSPTDVFYAYQSALLRARSFRQVTKYFSKRKQDWWKDRDTDERKELASLQGFYIDEADVTGESIDGNTARISVRGKGRVSSGKIKPAYAKITMVKERGIWKIDEKNISIGDRGVILIPQSR